MFFTIKLYLHLNCVHMLNWIVWNRTIFRKMDLTLSNLQSMICHKTQISIQPTQCDCIWVLSMGQIDLFKKDLYLIIWKILRNNQTKNVNMNATVLIHRNFNFKHFKQLNKIYMYCNIMAEGFHFIYLAFGFS